MSVFLLSGRRRSELDCELFCGAVLTSIIGRSLGRKLFFMVDAWGCMYDFTHRRALDGFASFHLLVASVLGIRRMIRVSAKESLDYQPT